MPNEPDQSLRPSVPTLTVQELEADPHAVYRRHRPLTPVIRREGGGTIVLRAADVEQLTRDGRVRQAETELLAQRGITDGTLFDLFRFGMLSSNGSAHRRRRAPLTRTFAAAAVAALRPAIRQAAGSLIDGWAGEREIDLVDRYGALIPAQAISAMLGLPAQDIPSFTRLVYSVSRFLGFTFSPDQLPAIQDDAKALYDYVEALLAGRRQSPGDDVLSAFLAEADAKAELSWVEIVIQVIVLIIGGTDTTRVAMASQVALLLQHREQWDAVCADPGLARQAVAEALRFEPSVGSLGRVTLQEITVGGAVIPAGELLTLSTLSAMRDDAVYARPDVFDIHRTDQRRLHPVFGAGAHRCLGEALAWAELEEGLTVLATRLPGLRLAGVPPRLQGHMGIRRIGEVPVTW